MKKKDRNSFVLMRDRRHFRIQLQMWHFTSLFWLIFISNFTTIYLTSKKVDFGIYHKASLHSLLLSRFCCFNSKWKKNTSSKSKRVHCVKMPWQFTMLTSKTIITISFLMYCINGVRKYIFFHFIYIFTVFIQHLSWKNCIYSFFILFKLKTTLNLNYNYNN